MLLLERKKSMKLFWKKYHYSRLWTIMKDHRFPKLSKMPSSSQETRLSQRGKIKQQTCISY
jgi:hypothetical protein